MSVKHSVAERSPVLADGTGGCERGARGSDPPAPEGSRSAFARSTRRLISARSVSSARAPCTACAASAALMGT